MGKKLLSKMIKNKVAIISLFIRDCSTYGDIEFCKSEQLMVDT